MLAPSAPRLEATVIRDPAVAEPVWRDLLKVSPASIYQSPDFLLPWLADHGREHGIEPFFILIRDRSGPVLLLPLGERRVGPFRLAESLGGKHANFNLPLVNPARLGDPALVRPLLVAAARQAGTDLLRLVNQPPLWRSHPNPLAFQPALPSPSFGYALTLDADADRLLQRLLSKDRRKKLRQKLKWLGELGQIAFEEALDGPTGQVMLDAYFRQKSERFGRQGIADPFAEPGIRRWIGRMSNASSNADERLLRLFGLKLADTYVAIWGVGQHGDTVSGMFTSFDAADRLARCSPGDLLLEWIIRRFCEEGIGQLDFGVGEAAYKTLWSDMTIPLFDTHLGVTAKGKLLAALMQEKTRAKRAFKQSPRLMKALNAVRRFGR